VTHLLAVTWGPGEIVLVLLVLLILFGGKKLPGLARSLGSSVTEFKKGIRGDTEASDADEKKKLDPPGKDPA